MFQRRSVSPKDFGIPETGWRYLGEGGLNKVYKNGKWVFKVPKKHTNNTEKSERVVRLWNEINPHIKPAARANVSIVIDNKKMIGSVFPYIEGPEASDDEISKALIELFNRTGRILVDATSLNNVIKTKNDQIVFVDISMAMLLELEPEDKRADQRTSSRSRRKSTVSTEFWNEMKSNYDSYFSDNIKFLPKVVKTTKALLYIKQHRPDISDASFLQSPLHPTLIEELAKAYDEGQEMRKIICKQSEVNTNTIKDEKQRNRFIKKLHTMKEKEQNRLDKIESVMNAKLNKILVSNFQTSCLKVLKEYVLSRGSITSEGLFKPSIRSRIFRDTEKTKAKAHRILTLMKSLRKAKTMQEIRDELESVLLAENRHVFFSSNWFTSHLAKSFRKIYHALKTQSDGFIIPDLEPPKPLSREKIQK